MPQTTIASSSRHTPIDTHAGDTTAANLDKGKAKVGSTPSRNDGPGNLSRASTTSDIAPSRSNSLKKLGSTHGTRVQADPTVFDTAAMLKATARTKAVVNMSNVRKNFRHGIAMIGSHDPSMAARGGAVVKADGYGLDAAAFAKVLASEGCRDFFVAELSEAVKLRQALKKDRSDLADQISINVLGGLDVDVDPQWYIDNDITPVINSVDQALHWEGVANKLGRDKLDCILQVDSGMNRTGIGGSEFDRLMAALDEGKLTHIAPQMVMSHLAKSGDADPATTDPATKERLPGDYTLKQLDAFNNAAAQLKKHFPKIEESLGASSTVFLGGTDMGKKIHKNMVRMGATFHAQAPFEADTNPLLPTLTVTTKLNPIGVREAGAPVGYSGTYTVPTEGARLATIPVGYRDLLPTPDRWEGLETSAVKPHVRVRTQDGMEYECKFAGKPSMDMSSINISDIPPEKVKEGLEVILIDEKMTTDQFAAQFGMGASYVQTKLASDRVAVIHEDKEAFPSPEAEPVVQSSPWSKAGREERQKAMEAASAGAQAAAAAARERATAA